MFHRNHKNPLTSEEVSEKREKKKKRGEEGKQERERKRKGMEEEGWKGGKQNKAEVSDL